MAWRESQGAINGGEFDIDSHLDLMISLQTLIKDHFNDDELRTLTFRMRCNYDDLPANSTQGKSRELVLMADRQNRLDELIGICRSERPSVNWPNAVNGKK